MPASRPLSAPLLLLLVGCASSSAVADRPSEARPANAPAPATATSTAGAGASAGAAAPVAATPTTTPSGRADAAAREASDADRAMAAAVAAGDVEAFAGHVAEDGIFFGERGASVGRAAVALSWAPFFASGGPRLGWAPDRSLASASGDLVFTWGPWTFTPPGGGPPATGRYLTAWRRDADGLLRVALDGTDAPPPEELPPGVTLHPLRTLFSADGQLLAEAGLLVDGTREAGHYLRLSQRDGSGFTPLSETGAFRPTP